MRINKARIEELLKDGLPGARVHFEEPTLPHAQASEELICIMEAPHLSLKLNFCPQTNDLNISSVDVEGKTMQKQGIGKKMLGNIMKVAEASGTERLSLFANEVGSYLWPRTGFTPCKEEFSVMSGNGPNPTRKSTIPKHIDELAHASAEEKEALHSILEHADGPRAIWAIADSKYGFDLLNDYGYHAELRMDDAQARDRFKTYTALSKEQEKAITELLQTREGNTL